MNILIKNIDIIPVDGEKDILKNTNLYIVEDKIHHIGDILENIKVDKIIDGKNKVLMPGLVNAHTHIGMSLLRNYADDLPLHDWLNNKIWPIEGKMTSEEIYYGSLLSMVEMIETGTTSFCDMYDSMDRVAEGVEEIGMRAVLTRGVIEDANKDKKLKASEELYLNWNNRANGRIKIMIAPHSPYTCSGDYLIELKNLADRLGTGIHIHVSETEKEVEDSISEKGKTPVEFLNDLGILDTHTIAAHCVHVNKNDIKILKEKNVFPVNNPTSNLKLASGFAPIEEMLKTGITVALGTDGSSSNNNLNMFEEMHIASILNKAVNRDATSVGAMDVIKMATINGAKALGLEEEIGSIEIGKKADIILIDMDKAHIYPIHNLISAIVYSAQGSDVDTVIIDGKIVMENRIINTIDKRNIIDNVVSLTEELLNR